VIRQIKNYLRPALAILGLFILASGVAIYILDHQRLRFPFVEPKPVRIQAELADAASVVPGQGQTVRIAGVEIGEIGGVSIDDGRAVISLDIEPKYRDVVRVDARALLRPRTGLKDMFVELDPGSESVPAVEAGTRIPIHNTLPDVDVDEVLSNLDADTREYLQLLISDGAHGLDGRGEDLRVFLRRYEPTHRDLARVSGALASRRRELKRVVHSMNELATELAGREDELSELVGSSATVFRAFSSERASLEGSLVELPAALRSTTTALRKVDRLATVLRPTADRLRPAARALPATNRQLRPFARRLTPLVHDQIRPFVRDARPLIRRLDPTARRLARAAPDLTRSMRVLDRLQNMVAFNPRGTEPPGAPGREEGYLFWGGWTFHQAPSLWSVSDAHGPMRRLLAVANCTTLRSSIENQPQLEFLNNLTPILTNSDLCPGD
jgi:phospholipid/cholesterol/gamma-HCH transport system substrate-binding protein